MKGNPNVSGAAGVPNTNVQMPSNMGTTGSPQAKPTAAPAPAAEPAPQAAPAAVTNNPTAAPAAKSTAPVRKQGGGKIPGQVSQSPSAVKKRQARAAAKGEPAKTAPSQAEIDADRNRLMGNFTDSVVRTASSLEEALAARVAVEKRKMFETSLANGDFKVFK